MVVAAFPSQEEEKEKVEEKVKVKEERRSLPNSLYCCHCRFVRDQAMRGGKEGAVGELHPCRSVADVVPWEW